MKFSIIIPVRNSCPSLEQALFHCSRQSYVDYEIIVVGNAIPDVDMPDKSAFIQTQELSPAAKRNIGALNSQGEILAFIDDDAIPNMYWLENAKKIFDGLKFSACCGPAIPMPSDNVWFRVSNDVLSSYVVSGPNRFRFLPLKSREVDDYPSCNLFVRRGAFEECAGFEASFFPGEDTKLCLDLKKRQKKIVYSPTLVVYHKSAPMIRPFLKKIAMYASSRGFLARKFPETSRKLPYILPSLCFILTLTFSILAIWSNTLRILLVVFGIVYFAILFISTFAQSNSSPRGLIVVGILSTHFVYGVSFLRGLLIFKREDYKKFLS